MLNVSFPASSKPIQLKVSPAAERSMLILNVTVKSSSGAQGVARWRDRLDAFLARRQLAAADLARARLGIVALGHALTTIDAAEVLGWLQQQPEHADVEVERSPLVN